MCMNGFGEHGGLSPEDDKCHRRMSVFVHAYDCWMTKKKEKKEEESLHVVFCTIHEGDLSSARTAQLDAFHPRR